MTEFEKQLHDMFDHIWECEIDHPVFQDTVGELMSAVIQCYNNLPSAQPEIVRCKDCRWHETDINQCGRQVCAVMYDDDYCSYAERG